MDWSGSPYYSVAVAAANTYGVPANLFTWQIGQESGFNPNAFNSTSGATGIAQFLPSTAADPGYGVTPFDPTDPNASLYAAAQYDAALYQKTGSWDAALQAYSGGSYGAPGNLGPSIGGSQTPPSSTPSPFSLATSGSTWSRIGLVVIGVVVLAGGLFMLGRSGNAVAS